MPTYDYECDACGHEMEVFQGINDPLKKKCPECGKSKLRRLFGTGAAVIFKGSGFYQTDYRSESYKKSENFPTSRSCWTYCPSSTTYSEQSRRLPRLLNPAVYWRV